MQYRSRPRGLWRREHWRRYLAAAGLVLYVLVFVRGLWWQWEGILFAKRTAPPPVQVRPAAPPSGAQPPAGAAPAPVANAPSGGAPAAQPGAKVPLPPTDEPPPRNTTDRYGVFYDGQGVAVMGIDTDPNGVYNVPPGRQVRIGGPSGNLFDVGPAGRLTPATRVKEWPSS